MSAIARRGVCLVLSAPSGAGKTAIARMMRKQELPLQRLATIEDVAAAVSFLLGDAAGFITGQTLNVDGGRVRT